MKNNRSAKQAFIQKLEDHLKITQREIMQVKAQYKTETGTNKAKIYEHIKELEQKKWATHRRLQALKQTPRMAWEDMKPEVEDAWGEMLTAAQRATEKLKDEDTP